MNGFIDDFYEWTKKKIPKGTPLWIFYRYIRNAINLNSEFPFTIYLYKVHGNIVLHKYKAIYFPVPKVACSSIKKFCADTLNMQIDGRDINEDIHYQHFPCVKRDQLNKIYKDYFKFCFVRNPWDRLVSFYVNKICPGKKNEETMRKFFKQKRNQKWFKPGMSFDECVESVFSIPDEKADAHFVSQYIYLTDDVGNILVDFVGKFENFDNDFRYIQNVMGINGMDIQHLMKSQHQNYRKYYNEKTKEMTKQRYQKDINMFGYEF